MGGSVQRWIEKSIGFDKKKWYPPVGETLEYRMYQVIPFVPNEYPSIFRFEQNRRGCSVRSWFMVQKGRAAHQYRLKKKEEKEAQKAKKMRKKLESEIAEEAGERQEREQSETESEPEEKPASSNASRSDRRAAF
jgi:tRNA(Ile)-lysidine synthase TilS/MesJ